MMRSGPGAYVVIDHGLVAGILDGLAEQGGQAGSLFHAQFVGTALAAADFFHVEDDGQFDVIRFYLFQYQIGFFQQFLVCDGLRVEVDTYFDSCL